jgi:hypothetical protein
MPEIFIVCLGVLQGCQQRVQADLVRIAERTEVQQELVLVAAVHDLLVQLQLQDAAFFDRGGLAFHGEAGTQSGERTDEKHDQHHADQEGAHHGGEHEFEELAHGT